MSRLAWLVGGPLAASMLLASDFTARRITGGHADVGLIAEGAAEDYPTVRLFPSLRALLVQVWLIRIDADIATSRPWRALVHARQALAIAPDLSVARVRLSDVLAWELPPREIEPDARVAWIAEALAILDEGIRRRPGDGLLHHARGILIANRGEQFPEFAARFARDHGVSTLEEGAEELIVAAELEPRAGYFVRYASVLVRARANARMAEGRRAEARADLERVARYLRTLIALSDFRKEPLQEELAEVEEELRRP